MYQTQSPQNYYPGPQVNAVKIDIINPQAYGSQAQQQPQMMPYNQGQYYYNVPQQPVYDMPVQSAYIPQQQYMAPPMPPQAPMIPPMPPQAMHKMAMAEQMAQPQPMQQAPVSAPIAQPVAPQAQQLPVAPQPQVIMTQANQAPVVPAPVISAPVQQPVAAQPQPIQQAPVQQPAPVAPAEQPAVDPSGVDVAGINEGLKSTDLEKQFEAIQKIAEIEQNSPTKAPALLTEETFTSLGEILTKDNTSLAGPTQEQLGLREKLQTGTELTPEEQAKAEELSPREIAEMNKQYATYSSAVLLKRFREEVAKDPAIETVPLGDLPLVSIVVENLKGNDNPLIREASISALNYLAKPEDKEVLNTLFNIAAQQDADEYVQAAAKDGLASVAKLAA